MFMLSNSQRQCFALPEIVTNWRIIEVRTSHYDNFKCYAFADGFRIKKCIVIGENLYFEMQYDEQLSSDQKSLLPKTSKGKPALFSASNLLKRKRIGMCLTYTNGHICLFNADTERDYYTNNYDNVKIDSMDDFIEWVNAWCNDTHAMDILNITEFSNTPKMHIQYKEGDVFQFKINRRLYGYGRILLNYDAMRKNKEVFWDIFMGKPLVCSVYHIVSDNGRIPVESLAKLKSLPSTIIMDNSIYYGNYKIIGNIPIESCEDYPIMYGASISGLDIGKSIVCFQSGRLYKALANQSVLPDCNHFINNGVSFSLNVSLDVLQQCILENSNAPYWDQNHLYNVRSDLRNPEHSDKLKRIYKQFDLENSERNIYEE